MEATFNFPIKSLNTELIKKIQALFSKNATVKISIIDDTQDETDYLLSVPQNEKMLKKSIKQLQDNKIVNKTIDELAI